MSSLPWLDLNDHSFPDPANALTDPNGLLAIGGDLDPLRIYKAYELGIFPWYEKDQPILWWAPDPRMVLFPEELHISKSLKKAIKQSSLKITYDQDFEGVIESCAGHRDYSSDTWITNEMMQAYIHLHHLGFAHSVEAWNGENLVGGLYGIAIGKVFYGESMFSHESNASKIAFVNLVQKLKAEGYSVIDCQISSSHLASFGAREISRAQFRNHLSSRTDSISNTI